MEGNQITQKNVFKQRYCLRQQKMIKLMMPMSFETVDASSGPEETTHTWGQEAVQPEVLK